MKRPESFEGLALWIEATAALCAPDGEQRVSRCLDQSGHSNDAEQPVLPDRPVLAESRINGHATLVFSPVLSPNGATYFYVSDHDSLRLRTDDFVYAFVGSWGNSPDRDGNNYYGYGRIVSKQATEQPYGGLVLLANYPAGLRGDGPLSTRLVAQVDSDGTFAISSSMGLNDNQFRLCLAFRRKDELEVRINGVTESKVRMRVGTDLSVPGASLLIGGSATEALKGEIAELVVVRNPTSLGVDALERHLMAKYAIE